MNSRQRTVRTPTEEPQKKKRKVSKDTIESTTEAIQEHAEIAAAIGDLQDLIQGKSTHQGTVLGLYATLQERVQKFEGRVKKIRARILRESLQKLAQEFRDDMKTAVDNAVKHYEELEHS